MPAGANVRDTALDKFQSDLARFRQEAEQAHRNAITAGNNAVTEFTNNVSYWNGEVVRLQQLASMGQMVAPQLTKAQENLRNAQASLAEVRNATSRYQMEGHRLLELTQNIHPQAVAFLRKKATTVREYGAIGPYDLPLVTPGMIVKPPEKIGEPKVSPCHSVRLEFDAAKNKSDLWASLIRGKTTELGDIARELEIGILNEAVSQVIETVLTEGIADGVLAFNGARAYGTLSSVADDAVAVTSDGRVSGLMYSEEASAKAQRALETIKNIKQTEFAEHTALGMQDVVEAPEKGRKTRSYTEKIVRCKELAREIDSDLVEQQWALNKLKDLSGRYVECLKAHPEAEQLDQAEKRRESLQMSRGPDFTVSAPGAPIDPQ